MVMYRSVTWSAVLGVVVGCVDQSQTPLPNGDTLACNALRRGDYLMTLELGGRMRSYRTHVPPGYDRRAVPLVIDLHGFGANSEQQFAISGWNAKADEQGFMLVHPRGVDASWNGGSSCCGPAQEASLDDEGFMRAIAARMVSEGCVDPARVYATGLSNGGALAHLLACRAADVFAATAPVSMGNDTLPCEPSRPISVIMFRGIHDDLVPYDGGPFPSAQSDFDRWLALNGCGGELEPATRGCRSSTQCEQDVDVTLCSIEGGHVLYAEALEQGAPVPDIAWAAFERHILP
jgi:polyhydroxybutyrate depolymerase